MVEQLFGGALYSIEVANRTALQANPKQILYRVTRPTSPRLVWLGYLQLEDSQLHTDDSLQRDPGALILANSWEGRLPHTLSCLSAGGQLYADDTLQQDMSYKLVTLSACETGRANVAASDDLIGLGLVFLYAD